MTICRRRDGIFDYFGDGYCVVVVIVSLRCRYVVGCLFFFFLEELQIVFVFVADCCRYLVVMFRVGMGSPDTIFFILVRGFCVCVLWTIK